MLYDLLEKGGFIDNDNYFVIVELPKDKILINGTLIKNPAFKEYMNVIKKFKIKSGNYREIRLSKQTIRIGDFKADNFTGTQMILVD